MDSFDIFLYLGYTLVIIAAVAAIILPLINALGNPQSLLKSGLGVVAIVALYFIAYAFSGSEVTQQYSKYEVGPELSTKWKMLLLLWLTLWLQIMFLNNLSRR